MDTEIKVYKKGNTVYVEIDGSTKRDKGFDVKILNPGNDDRFDIYSDDIGQISRTVDLIKKENGDPYTEQEFRDWADTNTGGFNGGGTTPLKTHGFLDYNDSSTSSSPIDLLPNVWTDVPNDKLGSFTNTNYPPDQVTNLMDGLTGYLDFSELTLGSAIWIRIDFRVTPNTDKSLLETRYVLGQGAGEYPLLVRSRRLDNGSGTPYDSEKGSFYIYMGDNNTLGGVGKLQVRLSTTGVLINNGVAIHIYRNPE